MDFGLDHLFVFQGVHEVLVLGEFRVVADDEDLAVERDRTGFHEIGLGEGVGAGDGVHHARPDVGERGTLCDGLWAVGNGFGI